MDCRFNKAPDPVDPTGSAREVNTNTNLVREQRNLRAIADSAKRLEVVKKAELDCGDCVQITTRNSTYWIQALEDELYLISGGWVELHGSTHMKTTIAGCSWGGSAIKGDIVAACGLHLEFGDGVVTSKIQEVTVIRKSERDSVH